VHAAIHNTFNLQRHLVSRSIPEAASVLRGAGGRIRRAAVGGALNWQLIEFIEKTAPRSLAGAAVKLRLLCDEDIGVAAGQNDDVLVSLGQIHEFIESEQSAAQLSPAREPRSAMAGALFLHSAQGQPEAYYGGA
jgi:hypothetical protein